MTDSALRLNALDGTALNAHHFRAQGPAANAFVVMAGATGVAQRYYRRFATELAAIGLEVITFDFRGVGESRPPSLRGFDGSFTAWAQDDLPAVVDHALARGPVAVVGHSFGGHAFGQLPSPNRTLGLYTVATGAAWSGYMARLERLKVETMWQLLGPVVTGVAGHLPGVAWGGEPLPLGVYREWKRWSRFPNYFFDDRTHDFQALFDRVRVPVVGVTSSDDAWAPPASMQAFMSHYRNAPLSLVVDSPSDLGVRSVGHMGHFKAAALPRFVPRVAAWVRERLASEGAADAGGGDLQLNGRALG